MNYDILCMDIVLEAPSYMIPLPYIECCRSEHSYVNAYMYSRRHNKVSVPFLLPFRFLVVLPFLLPFVTIYNRSVF